MINNYDSEMIYNPETNKLVKVGGNVGKKVFGGYKKMVGGLLRQKPTAKAKVAVAHHNTLEGTSHPSRIRRFLDTNIMP